MQSKNHLSYGSATIGAAMLLAASGQVQALSYEFGEIDVDLETSLTAGVAIRGGDADTNLISKANVANTTNFGNNPVAGSAAKGYYASPNGDDGNQAFADAGDLFFAQAKLSSDLTIKVGDWGVFARGNYRYDPNIKSDNLFDRFDYGPNRSRSFDDKARRESLAEDAAGNDAELFDLYLFGNFKIGDRSASIRIGRQVFNWGESTFIANGINSIIPIDARQARGPGAEVKEVFRPFAAAWAGLELTDSISIEAFYQFDWEETIPDPSGTYFSTSDVVGAGATGVQTGFGRCNEHILPVAATGGAPGPDNCVFAANGTDIPRVSDPTLGRPEDGGQYGARLNFFLDWLNSTEVSFYAINYHSRLPLFGAITAPDTAAPPVNNPPASRFFLTYPEDIKLYGLSFNTFLEFAEVAFQGEYSFKKDQPLAIDGVEFLLFSLRLPGAGPGTTFQTVGRETGKGGATAANAFSATGNQQITSAVPFDVHQADFSFLKRFGPNWTGANATNILLEVAGQYVENLPQSSVLPIESRSGTELPNQTDLAALSGVPSQIRTGYADTYAWGYRLLVANTYNNVFNRFNLTPLFTFFHDVSGNSPAPIANHLAGTKQSTLGLSASYLDAWEAGMSYTFFFGGRDVAAAPTSPDPAVFATQVGNPRGGQTNNVVADRDFFNMFVRYTF